MAGSGFPNPVEEAGSMPLDLIGLVVKSPASTFFMRVDGDFHAELGIHSGDVVIIDKSLQMRPGDLVVVHEDGEFGFKRLPKDTEIEMEESDNLHAWGVVTYTLHSQRDL